MHSKISFLIVFTTAALLLLTCGHAGQLLGPTGISGTVSDNSITVTNVAEGSPAYGQLEKGAVIVGIGDKIFQVIYAGCLLRRLMPPRQKLPEATCDCCCMMVRRLNYN